MNDVYLCEVYTSIHSTDGIVWYTILMERSHIWIFITVGSLVGGYVPLFWGSGMFSFSSVMCSAIGAFIGIWVHYRMNS